MKQFDIFENGSAKSRAAVPYLVVMQHDRVSDTSSVMVSGLVPLAKNKAIATSRLYPVLLVGAKEFVLLTPNMAAVPRRVLVKHVGNAGEAQRRIIDAIDLLFTGF